MRKNSRTGGVFKIGLIGIGICAVIFFIGLTILNILFTEEELPTEITFQFVIGISLVIFSVFGTIFLIKYILDHEFRKRRRLERKRRFLKRKEQEKKIEQ